MFRSAGAVYAGSGVLRVVLTGMGSDGLAGCRLLRGSGSTCWRRIRPSSAVWGMPGAVANAGLAQTACCRWMRSGRKSFGSQRTGRRQDRRLTRPGKRRLDDGNECVVDYGFLRRLVLGYSHNVLDPSRDYLFDSRLARVLRNLGMSQLEELVDHLRSAQGSGAGAGGCAKR